MLDTNLFTVAVPWKMFQEMEEHERQLSGKTNMQLLMA